MKPRVLLLGARISFFFFGTKISGFDTLDEMTNLPGIIIRSVVVRTPLAVVSLSKG